MDIKNAEFHADFKSVEKVFKNVPKKVISKNMTEICTFSLLLMFIKLVLIITFFGTFFKFIIVLFSNFEAKQCRKKSKLSKGVLDLNFAPI